MKWCKYFCIVTNIWITFVLDDIEDGKLKETFSLFQVLCIPIFDIKELQSDLC